MSHIMVDNSVYVPIPAIMETRESNGHSLLHSDERLTLLVVSPEPELSRFLQVRLERIGMMQVQLAHSGKEALEKASAAEFDATISDYDMPDMNGIELHAALMKAGVQIPFILFTIPDELRNIPAEDPISTETWPIDTLLVELIQRIRQAVELYRTRNQLELYSKELEKQVSERTKELHQAQRLAVIGELSTMIGHDMRNPLQVIANLNFLMKGKLSQMNPDEMAVLERYGIGDIISKIGAESLYLNKIVSDLQDYASEVSLKIEKCTIEPFLSDILVSMEIPSSVTIRKEYQTNLEIFVDPFIFKRVLESIIMNAIQAMQNKGVLTLSLSRKEGFVDVLIADTGPGIPSSIQKNIFEPLFTTKSKGTGFGLAVSRRLMEIHGGEVVLLKSDKSGTTFEIKFPEKNWIKSDDTR